MGFPCTTFFLFRWIDILQFRGRLFSMSNIYRPTNRDIKAAVSVLTFLRDKESEETGARIDKAPSGKHWDGYVSRICAKSEAYSEQIDSLIEDVKNLIK